MCHQLFKNTIIRGSYNIHRQIICEVVIEVVIVLTFSFSKKVFVNGCCLTPAKIDFFINKVLLLIGSRKKHGKAAVKVSVEHTK